MRFKSAHYYGAALLYGSLGFPVQLSLGLDGVAEAGVMGGSIGNIFFFEEKLAKVNAAVTSNASNHCYGHLLSF